MKNQKFTLRNALMPVALLSCLAATSPTMAHPFAGHHWFGGGSAFRGRFGAGPSRFAFRGFGPARFGYHGFGPYGRRFHGLGFGAAVAGSAVAGAAIGAAAASRPAAPVYVQPAAPSVVYVAPRPVAVYGY